MSDDFKIGKHNILYVLGCFNQEYVKIGICMTEDHINKRIKTLQTGNPSTIELLYSEERYSAKDAEKYLHNVFAKDLVRGEWFKGITLTDIRRKLMLFHDQR